MPSVPYHSGCAVAFEAPAELCGLFTQNAVDLAFRGRPALQTWAFDSSSTDAAYGAGSGTATRQLPDLDVVDIFSDGSVFALGVPGHTAGSTAYLVRSTTGPVLLVGDTSHTRWGWEHAVEPGDFTLHGVQNRESLLKLKALVASHPEIEVRLGHQP